MKRSSQRNLRLLGYALLDLGCGVLLGVGLGLAAVIQALQVLA